MSDPSGGLSDQCLQQQWNREKLMEHVKYNSPQDIIKSMFKPLNTTTTTNNNNQIALKGRPPNTNHIYLNRKGEIIPERDDDQDHLRRKNHINGVDRTAWVYSAQPHKEREKKLALDREKENVRLALEAAAANSGPILVMSSKEREARDKPTFISEMADILGEGEENLIDLHTGFENAWTDLPREVHKENDSSTPWRLAAEDKPRPERVLDRMTTRRIIKAGKRLKECHKFACATEMADYDDAQHLALLADSEAIRKKASPKAKVVFDPEDTYDNQPISYMHLYDDLIVKTKFARRSREAAGHFPGGVPVQSKGMSTIERINGIPVAQIIHERHYPNEEASLYSENSFDLKVEQRKMQSALKKEQIKLNRQASKRVLTTTAAASTTTSNTHPHHIATEVTATNASPTVTPPITDTATDTDNTTTTPTFMAGVEQEVIPNLIRHANPFTHLKSNAIAAGEVHDTDNTKREDSDRCRYYLVKRTQDIIEAHHVKLANQTYKLKCTQNSTKGIVNNDEKRQSSTSHGAHHKFSLKKKHSHHHHSTSTATPATGSGDDNVKKKKKYKLKLKATSSSNASREITSSNNKASSNNIDDIKYIGISSSSKNSTSKVRPNTAS